MLDPETEWPNKIYCLDSFHGKVQTCDVRVENDRIVIKIVDTVQAAMDTVHGEWVKVNKGVFVWTSRSTHNFAMLNPQTGGFNIHRLSFRKDIELPISR